MSKTALLFVPSMFPDNLDRLTLGLSWLGLCAVATVFALSVYFRTLYGDPEDSGVDYSVPIPEQCRPNWEGEELEEVQLKVSTLEDP